MKSRRSFLKAILALLIGPKLCAKLLPEKKYYTFGRHCYAVKRAYKPHKSGDIVTFYYTPNPMRFMMVDGEWKNISSNG